MGLPWPRRRVNNFVDDQEAERIDEDVALASLDLLARIKPCGSSAEPLFEPLWRSCLASKETDVKSA